MDRGEQGSLQSAAEGALTPRVTMDQLLRAISELGILVTIAALFLMAIMVVVWKVFSKGGYLDRVVEAHISMLTSTLANYEDMRKNTEHYCNILEEICKKLGCLDEVRHDFSHIRHAVHKASKRDRMTVVEPGNSGVIM